MAGRGISVLVTSSFATRCRPPAVDLALLAARRIPAPLRMQSLSGIGAPQRVHARIGAPLGRRSFAGGSGGIPTPVDAVEAFIRAGHEVVGLPWWLAIAGSALAVRLAFLPLVLYSRRVSARYSSLKPHRQLAFALATSSAKEKREQYLDYVRAVWIQCSLFDSNPLKALVAPLAMIPVFISFAWAMRRMAIPGSGMELGGILWFEDLTLPDVHFPGIMSLAIINCAIVLANLVVSFRTTDRSLLYVKDICMVLVVAMTCFTAQLPQGFFMYWIPSSLFALVTTLLTRHPLMQERLLRSAWAGRKLPPPVQDFFEDVARQPTEHAARASGGDGPLIPSEPQKPKVPVQ